MNALKLDIKARSLVYWTIIAGGAHISETSFITECITEFLKDLGYVVVWESGDKLETTAIVVVSMLEQF